MQFELSTRNTRCFTQSVLINQVQFVEGAYITVKKEGWSGAGGGGGNERKTNERKLGKLIFFQTDSVTKVGSKAGERERKFLKIKKKTMLGSENGKYGQTKWKSWKENEETAIGW